MFWLQFDDVDATAEEVPNRGIAGPQYLVYRQSVADASIAFGAGCDGALYPPSSPLAASPLRLSYPGTRECDKNLSSRSPPGVLRRVLPHAR